mgnify:CR=1 FL=1
MSEVAQHPIRFLLSDMDGTLLLPDHSLSQRTIDAVRALREAGVLFSLATGRPPKAMLQAIEALGVDLPTAAFNGGTIVNPDGSLLVAHYLPVTAALIALALFADLRHPQAPPALRAVKSRFHTPRRFSPCPQSARPQPMPC